jgi:enterochelin esterase family protein
MPLSQILIDGEGWKRVEGKPQKPAPETGMINNWPGAYGAKSPDQITTYIYPAGGSFIQAATKWPMKSQLKVAPYCPLRVRRGEKDIAVTGLVTDTDGRIYAATEIGVQVFDPTGRLCGVLTPAAPGKPEFLAFEGDRLTMWIGDTKYARKLNATGAK